MAKHSATILDWARRGAEARWAELQAEVRSLVQAFPHLASHSTNRKGRVAKKRPASAAVSNPDASPKKKRRRPALTAAQKAAVSARMKRYWAERRKAKSAKNAKLA
jgi:hypothetical protein